MSTPLDLRYNVRRLSNFMGSEQYEFTAEPAEFYYTGIITYTTIYYVNPLSFDNTQTFETFEDAQAYFLASTPNDIVTNINIGIGSDFSVGNLIPFYTFYRDEFAIKQPLDSDLTEYADFTLPNGSMFARDTSGDLEGVTVAEAGKAIMACSAMSDIKSALAVAVSEIDGLETALAGKSDTSHTHTASQVTDFSTAADARITTQKGANSGLATLDSGGKIPTTQLPGLAITSTFVVASQVAQLALTAQEGDIAVRSDQNKTYAKNAGTAGTMADWTELLSPTGSVTSFNGRTGAVSPASGDYAAGDITGLTEAAQDAVGAALSSEFVYNDGANTIGLRARSFNNTASHSIVTTAAAANGFQLSTTRDATVNYSVTIISTATIAGSATGYVALEIASTNSTTAGDWVEIGRTPNGQAVSLAVVLQSVSTGGGQVGGMVPAGYYARLRSVNTAGTPSYSYNSGQEVLL